MWFWKSHGLTLCFHCLVKLTTSEEIGPEILSRNVLPITKFPFILVLNCLKLSSWLNNVDFSEWKHEGERIFLFVDKKTSLRKMTFLNLQIFIRGSAWGKVKEKSEYLTVHSLTFTDWAEEEAYKMLQAAGVSIQADQHVEITFKSNPYEQLRKSWIPLFWMCWTVSATCALYLYMPKYVCTDLLPGSGKRTAEEDGQVLWKAPEQRPVGSLGLRPAVGIGAPRLSSCWIVHDGKHSPLHCLSARRLHGANSWVAVFLFAQCLHSFGTCFIEDCW